MFEGVQDQFHQFLTAAAAASNSTPISTSSSHHPNPLSLPLPPPLSFSLLHGCTTSSSPSPPSSFPSVLFHDPYNNPVQAHLHHQILQQQLQWGPPAAHTKLQVLPGRGGEEVIKQEGEREASTATHIGLLSTSVALERERSMAVQTDLIDSAAWSQDEVLALLRIRSALENWFPEFTWEHVSRKLSELGFERTPQKCKEKFEEESRSYFQTTTSTTKNNDITCLESDVSCPTKTYRLFSELEELCHHGHDPSHHHHHHLHHHRRPTALIDPQEDGNENQGDAIPDKQNPQREVEEQEQQEQGRLDEDDGEQELGQEERVHDKMVGQLDRSLDENDGCEGNDKMDQEMEETQERKKAKRSQIMNRKRKFEIFKRFCEEIVNKMMSQQEELHNKILQDMIRRDDEKTAREEAWRKQEMERINKEMEARARDLAMVSDRQAKIIEFLKKFASNSSTSTMKNDGNNEAPKSTHQNPSSSATHSSPNHLPTSSNEGSISQTSNPNPNAKSLHAFQKPRPNKRLRSENCSDGNDIGKRWPREEVLALINIRCNVDVTNKIGVDDSSLNQNRSNSGSNNNSNGSTKNPPLWERISQKMMEMGYDRSAKRCKEKWENINKYFRKTKDMNKNRSVDSRTCPYFHQLSHLYNQGRVTGGGEGHGGGGGGGSTVNMDVSDQGEDVSGVQVTTKSAACDLEF